VELRFSGKRRKETRSFERGKEKIDVRKNTFLLMCV